MCLRSARGRTSTFRIVSSLSILSFLRLVYADSTGNTFWNYKNSIVKLDAGYTKLDEYTIPDLNSVMNVSALAKTANTIFHDDGYRRWDYNDSVALDLSQGIQSDNGNHLYLLLKAADSTDARAPVVIKLDADFDEIGTFVVPRMERSICYGQVISRTEQSIISVFMIPI